MQVKAGVDKGVYYEFVYVEAINKILIFKNERFEYEIKVMRSGKLVTLNCDCPGSRNHGHCKHMDFCEDTFDFNKVVKPRAWISLINEKFIIEKHLIEKGGFYYE